jgi:hypothetical protein
VEGYTDMQFKRQATSAGGDLWHPAVHNFYQEECYFFLLRLEDPIIENLESQMTTALRNANASSYCLYLLFGYYDVMIRIWCRSEVRRSLVLELRRLPGRNEIHEFRAEEIRYLWDDSSGRPASLESAIRDGKTEPEIAQLIAAMKLQLDKAISVANEQADPSSLSDDDLASLRSAGFILSVNPASDEQAFKFYVALQTTRPGGGARQLTAAHIEGVIRATPLPFENISLYVGQGFGSCLLKGVVGGFPEIIDGLGRLTEAFRDDGLRPMTLLIARAPLEVDLINRTEAQERLGLLDSQFLSALGSSVQAEDLARLADEDRGVLVRAFFDGAHLTNTPFGPFMLEIFAATVKGDLDRVEEKMVVLSRLEGLLRRYLIEQVWSEKFGKDFRARVLEIAGEATSALSDAERGNPTKWGGGFLLRAAGRVAKAHPDVEMRMDEELGLDWASVLADERLLDLRNAMAHGTFYYSVNLQSNFSSAKGWGASLHAVLRAGDKYNRLIGLLGVAQHAAER